jgi:hypothetical protein
MKIERIGKDQNAREKYNLLTMSKNGFHMNDIYIDDHKPIFEALLELSTR